MDMPGFGTADKPEDFDYSVPGYARHLGKLLADRGVRRAHLVMHDFGGPWGLAWAANNPQAVASVTCINTGVLSGYRWHYLARIWQTPILGELFMATTTKPGMRLLLRHGNPRGLPSEYFDHVFQTFDRGTRRAVLKLYRNTRKIDDAARQLTVALRPLDLPALIVWGAHDPYIPVAFAERQREVFPRAEIKILNDSGHWPFADDPNSVAQAVLPFLRRQLRK
jgi:pimeloyl-ACP methyl ester carboxylesterase